MKEAQVDVFCGQEHNLDTTQTHVRSILFETANQHWKRNRLVMGTSPITFHTPYKPGGTLAITVGSLTGRVNTQVRDKWGRWVCQEYQGRATRKVVVISAYQPVQNSSTTGNITVAAQQQSLILREGKTPSNPRAIFRKDLSLCIKQYYANEVAILLVGDFNETLGSDPDGMIQLVSDFGLVDLMASRHPNTPPATYSRG
jgi:hypothetical protein